MAELWNNGGWKEVVGKTR